MPWRFRQLPSERPSRATSTPSCTAAIADTSTSRLWTDLRRRQPTAGRDPIPSGAMSDILDGAGLDPAVPAAPPVEPRRWWGRHLAEIRWQAELARLIVDPV